MALEGSMIDLGLHIVTVAVALLLFLIALKAYRKKQSRKFGFVCAAFGVFALKELLIALNILSFSLGLLTGIAHLLNLAILGLFFYGVVR